jgi:tetratricopeptide (TPR) repeat protein
MPATWTLPESLNQRSLTLHRELYGNAHPLVAEDLINLGAIQYERGRYVDAEAFYRQALEIIRTWYGNDSYRTASNLTMLGRCLYQEKRFDEANGMLSDALAIQEQVFGKVHPRVASALNDLGNVAMGQERFDDAERHFRRIGEIYRAVYGDKHYLVGIASSNLAGVYMARRDFTYRRNHVQGGGCDLLRDPVSYASEHRHRAHQARSIAASARPHGGSRSRVQGRLRHRRQTNGADRELAQVGARRSCRRLRHPASARGSGQVSGRSARVGK